MFVRRSILMAPEGTPAGGDWRGSLPEEIRASPALKDVPDVATLAKNFVETKALVGASIRPPGADAGPEARKAFIAKLQEVAPELVLVPADAKARAEVEDSIWKTLGKPADAKGYVPPKDVELPPQVLEQLRAEAAAEGLTARQFEARATRAAASLAATTKAQTEAKAALKVELGAAYEERVAVVAAAAAKLGFPEQLVAAVKAGQVDLPTFKALATVAKSFSEGGQGALQGDGGGGGLTLTPAEAKVQMAEIRARPEYWDRSKGPALHDSLKTKMLELSKAAFPEG